MLNGKRAVVTGSTSGIGLGIARALAAQGAKVMLNGFGDAAALEALKKEFPAYSGADISKRDEVRALIADADRKLGGVDILVNNAGIGIIRGVEDLTEADFDLTIAVNLKSAFLCTQAVLPGMRARRWGRIVNISSGAARGAGGIGVHYNASKAGMEGLTRGYAARLVKDGITVNAVAPSLIDTDMMNARRDQYVARIPLGRMGTAEEVARAVVMVVGNEYMTGQTIQLNGGTNFI